MKPKRYRYRVTVFDEPRGRWRRSFQEAKDDAISAGLASYDESEGQYFLAVPVSVERQEIPPRRKTPAAA